MTREWPAVEPVPIPIGQSLAVLATMASTIVLVTLLFPTSLEGPLPILCTPVELLMAILAATLAWLVLTMVGEEGRLNARGETLLWRRVDRRRALVRTERALRRCIEDLARGGGIAGIIRGLQVVTHGGDALPDGRARWCYDVAIGILEGVAGGNRVGERALREAGEWL